MPQFTIVGLGDTSVKESRERVRASIKNSGATFPAQRKTVNLAPAELRNATNGEQLEVFDGNITEVIAGSRPYFIILFDDGSSELWRKDEGKRVDILEGTFGEVASWIGPPANDAEAAFARGAAASASDQDIRT